MLDAEDLLGPGQVGEAVLAEVGEPHPGGKVVAGEVARRPRTQDLSGLGQGQQPGRAVERRPDPVVTASFGGAGVDGHPHPQRRGRLPLLALQNPLAGHGRRHRCGRGREGGAQPVPCVGEDTAAGPLHLGPEQVVVAGEVGGHRLAVALPPLRAGFDVGEQKRDGVVGRGDRGVEVGALGQHLLLELAEVRAGFHAELLDEELPGPLVDAQGVGLAALAVEGHHQAPPGRLPQRVLGRHRFQRHLGGRRVAAGQLSVGQALPGRYPRLFESVQFRTGVVDVGQLGQRRASPSGQPGQEAAHGFGGVAGGERPAGGNEVLVEPMGVEARRFGP